MQKDQVCLEEDKDIPMTEDQKEGSDTEKIARLVYGRDAASRSGGSDTDKK